MSETRNRILEYVMDHQRADVAELAAMLAVSQVTVRKNLDALERDGLLRREHGYAVAVSEDNMLSRLALHHDIKRRIARRAAESVADGESVMIESGSSCALLARALFESRRGITVVTNSAFIADYTRRIDGADVVLLGGNYQTDAQVCVGPLAVAAAANFYVSKLFIGVDGYTEESGFTAKNLQRAEMVRAMARQAAELVVVTESLKFPKMGAVRLVGAADVHSVYTDDRLPAPIQQHLTSEGVTVVKVPADAPRSK